VATVNLRSGSVRGSEVGEVVSALVAAAVGELRAEGFDGEPEVSAALGLRYAGQNYEHAVGLDDLNVTDETLGAAFERFERLHEEFYGYSLGGETIELVEVSVSAQAATPELTPLFSAGTDVPERRRLVRFDAGEHEARVLRRAALGAGASVEGPAIVEEEDSTTLLEPGDRLSVLADGTLAIDVAAGADWIR
jgi:N-methylhydantoinase A